MTPDELDRRVKDIAEEAERISHIPGPHPPTIETAICLALEGWEKPDPLLQAWRDFSAIKYPWNADEYRSGAMDCQAGSSAYMDALRRGYELGKEAAR